MPANELHPDDAAAIALVADELLALELRLQLLSLAATGLRAALDSHGDVDRQQYLGRVTDHLQTARNVLGAAYGLMTSAERVDVPLPEVPLPDPVDVVLPTPLPDAPVPLEVDRDRPDVDQRPQPRPQRPQAARAMPTEGDRPGGLYLDRQRPAQDLAWRLPADTDETTELVGLAALLRPDLDR